MSLPSLIVQFSFLWWRLLLVVTAQVLLDGSMNLVIVVKNGVVVYEVLGFLA